MINKQKLDTLTGSHGDNLGAPVPLVSNQRLEKLTAPGSWQSDLEVCRSMVDIVFKSWHSSKMLKGIQELEKPKTGSSYRLPCNLCFQYAAQEVPFSTAFLKETLPDASRLLNSKGLADKIVLFIGLAG